MVLQGFVVLLKVEVGVAQLAVDGAEDLKVLRSNLDRGLEEGHADAVVAGLTEPLAFQSQVQTRRLHPAGSGRRVRHQRELRVQNSRHF